MANNRICKWVFTSKTFIFGDSESFPPADSRIFTGSWRPTPSTGLTRATARPRRRWPPCCWCTCLQRWERFITSAALPRKWSYFIIFQQQFLSFFYSIMLLKCHWVTLGVYFTPCLLRNHCFYPIFSFSLFLLNLHTTAESGQSENSEHNRTKSYKFHFSTKTKSVYYKFNT